MIPMSSFNTNPPNIRFASTTAPSAGFDIHYHSFYELYFFVEGDADYLVEGKVYHLTPNSLLLLSPNVFHGVRVNSDAPYVRCAIHFSPDIISPERRTFLLSSFPGNTKNSPKEVFYEHTDTYCLRDCLNLIIQAQKQQSGLSRQYFPIYMETLLAQISLMCQTLRPTQVTSSAPEPIIHILTYLNEHLTEELSLDDLSERFFISKYYMNRAFKKATGTTVMDYVHYKRIVMARQLILNGTTAQDAASECGFGDYSVFYRSYKKFIGHGPAQDKNS